MRGQSHPVGIKQLRVPAVLFVAVVFWIIVQNATWTPSFMHHPIWAMTADTLGKPVAGSISVNRDLTALALLRLLTSASVFWIAVQLCRNTSRVNLFMAAIAVIVACLFGLWPRRYSLWTREPFTWVGNTLSTGFVTSTFYDRSHFATYAGIGSYCYDWPHFAAHTDYALTID